MLAFLRGLVRSKVSMVIIGLLIIGLSAYALPNVFSSSGPRGLISAGKRYVLQRDVDQKLDSYIQAMSASTGKALTRQELARNGIADQMLQAIASETAMLAYADKIGVEASRFAVAKVVADAQPFKNPLTGKFDSDQYRQYAARMGLTTEQLEKDLRDDLTISHLNRAVSAGLDVPDSLARIWVVSQSEQRQFSYIRMTPDLVGKIAKPTEEQLKAFFEERKSMFEEPERRSATVLSFSASDFLSKVDIPEADIEIFYKDNSKRFSSPETRSIVEFKSKDRAQIQKVVDDIGAGGDPAKLTPDAVVKTPRAIKPADISPDNYAAALFSAKIGDAVGPILIGEDWTAAVTTDVTPGEMQPLEEVRPVIEQELGMQEAGRKFSESHETFYDLIGGGYTLEEVAEELGARLVQVPEVDQRGRGTDGNQLNAAVLAPETLRVLFGLLGDGDHSDVLDGENESLQVVRLDKIKPKRIPSLKEIEEDVRDVYLGLERRKALEAKAEELAAAVRNGDSMETVAESAGLKLEQPDKPLSRRSIPQGLSRPMAIAVLGAKEKEVVIASEDDGGKTVIRLEAIDHISDDQIPLMIPTAKRLLTEALEQDIQSVYYQAALREADLQTNDSAINAYLKAMAGDE